MSSDRGYRVMVDDAGHHSIWADGRALPPGWRATGVTGTKRECLDHVTRLWLLGGAERRDLTPSSRPR